ncbi:MAG: T9SS type A sorting domain-containing protein [Bacteroidales bacterium]|nr:T9SS type A sorting domain-containing protein [Bacteroidales bacterium]
MKTKLILLLVFNSTLVFSQYFAPVGAKWNYTVKWAFALNNEETYMTVNSTKDTLINNIRCSKLESSMEFCGGYAYRNCFVYSSDSIVYFFDKTIGEFQILYNFKAKANDSWIIKYPTHNNIIDTVIISVISVSNNIINSKTLKSLNVSYKSYHNPAINYNSHITEILGDNVYLFNFYYYGIMCDSNYSDGLRCYEDNTFGFYSTGIADSCTYSYYVGINGADSKTINVDVFPNPAVEQITLLNNSNFGNLIAELYNTTGELIRKEPITIRTTWNISYLNSGLYFIKIHNSKNNDFKFYKLVKR